MSVILDALHKARGDKRNRRSDQQPNSVARVLDAGVAPDTTIAGGNVNGDPAAQSRVWVIAVSVLFGLLCLIALIGGAFFLLYDQVKQLEYREAAAKPTLEAASPQNAPIPAGMPPALPTPMPLTELPVQPPAAATGGAASAAPKFTLGSIVCENNNCIASLNGRSVHVGDEVQQYRVIEITSTEIALKSITGNEVVRLSLY